MYQSTIRSQYRPEAGTTLGDDCVDGCGSHDAGVTADWLLAVRDTVVGELNGQTRSTLPSSFNWQPVRANSLLRMASVWLGE